MERRLTTILSADVVGYSRLMALDEAGTLAQLKSQRNELIEPRTTKYNGRVVKLMGDGTLMEFGSVVDAVNFAVDVQRTMAKCNQCVPADRRIAYRIGINIGDIIVEGDDIYGEGVNVAARLEGLAEVDGICVSRNVYNQVKSKVDVAFEDLGEKMVKNIPEPVQIYRVRLGAGEAQANENANGAHEAPPLPDKPSIAVLPFDNMSGDPEQEYFSDGISEDAITDLSKISSLFVVARNSSFCYKGEAVNIKNIARELGVRYVVEGSVRRAGNRVRITAQLIDASSGGHLWADRYDRELDDIFSVQDEITKNIVNALQLVLLPGEAEAVAHASTTDFQAYDFYLKGRQCSNFERKAKYIEARKWFEQAIERDPNFALAYCGLADCGLELFWWAGDKKNLEGVFEASPGNDFQNLTDHTSIFTVGGTHCDPGSGLEPVDVHL